MRHEHGHCLSQHGGFGFDASDAPTEHAQAVDHGGMGIGADQGVGIGKQFAFDLRCEDDACEVFEIDLVADAHAGRDGAEIAKRGLSPLEKCVAFAVALKFEEGVGIVGTSGAEFVDLDGVVDDQLGGNQRVHTLRVASEGLDGIAHGAEIDDGRNAGEVLHEDAGGHVGDFAAGLGFCVPPGEEFDVGSRDVDAIFAAQQVLEQDLEAERKTAQIETAGGESGKTEDRIRARARLELGTAGKTIHWENLSIRKRADRIRDHQYEPG